MANKPQSTKNIETALGIADDVSKLSNISSDDEKKKQFEERQNKLKAMQEELKIKRATYQEDKDFIKDMYKELAETAMVGVRIMQEEAGMTGDYKNVEALAAAANAVSQALDGLKSVEHDEEKLRIEREKIEVKRLSNINTGKGGIISETTNIYAMGTTADIIRSIKEAEAEKNKTIDVDKIESDKK
jgi:hypothetical protein